MASCLKTSISAYSIASDGKSKFLPLFLFRMGLCCLREETDRVETK